MKGTNSRMASSKPLNSKLPAKPGSQKLGQTLHELESAFADWEALSDSAPTPHVAAAAPKESRSEIELRKKTKMLLDQLREQIKELAD